MRTYTRREIVSGATHLFVEAGALERVADLAADWFTRFLAASRDGLKSENRAG